MWTNNNGNTTLLRIFGIDINISTGIALAVTIILVILTAYYNNNNRNSSPCREEESVKKSEATTDSSSSISSMGCHWSEYCSEEKEDDKIPPVQIVEEKQGTDVVPQNIVNLFQMQQIAQYVLPFHISSNPSLYRWKRLYSLSRDGDCFHTCLRLTEKQNKTVMILQTTKGEIFGGYAESSWEVNHCQYYGTSQTCLFTFSHTTTNASEETRYSQQQQKQQQEQSSSSSSPKTTHNSSNSTIQNSNDKRIRVYKWTGRNRYFQYCDASRQMLAFGGGGNVGSFGLCVQQYFQFGTTGVCETFDNAPLCSTKTAAKTTTTTTSQQEIFHIIDLEIWGFGLRGP